MARKASAAGWEPIDALRAGGRAHCGRRCRSRGDLGGIPSRHPVHAQHVRGVVLSGGRSHPPAEHRTHDGEQRAPGADEGDVLVRHVEAPRSDTASQIACGVRAQGDQGGVPALGGLRARATGVVVDARSPARG